MIARENTKRCFWCNADPEESAKRHEGPHATWCPYYALPPRPPSSLDDIRDE